MRDDRNQIERRQCLATRAHSHFPPVLKLLSSVVLIACVLVNLAETAPAAAPLNSSSSTAARNTNRTNRVQLAGVGKNKIKTTTTSTSTQNYDNYEYEEKKGKIKNIKNNTVILRKITNILSFFYGITF